MKLDREQKESIRKEFALHKTDTGSTEVQIATLTECINYLTRHCKDNHKDYSSRRGLLKMVNRRKNYLSYLARKDEEKYKELIKRLGLRK